MNGNKEKLKWYVLIAMGLLLGILIGYFATNALTTGNALEVINAKQVSKSQTAVDISGYIKALPPICFCGSGERCVGFWFDLNESDGIHTYAECSCCNDSIWAGGAAYPGIR